MRICSFLPSATEILYALGLGESVVGISYECDYPPEVRGKPVVVHSRLPPATSSAELDLLVSRSLGRGESLYRVDVEALARLQPDLIVTQDLCHVCAATPDDLSAALNRLPRHPQVLSLSPRTLGEVLGDIGRVGEAADRVAVATRLRQELESRAAQLERAVARARTRPRVLCLEWLDPPFVAGHWVPEMVERAGGQDALGQAGEPSRRVSWEEIAATQPDVVLIMPCGYGLAETLAEFRALKFPPAWEELPAVKSGRVFAVDASSYFSRPGPRLAKGLELLAGLLHPALVPHSVPPGAVSPT